MAEVQQPYIDMFTVCEKVECSPDTRDVTNIIGIRHRLTFEEFPVVHPLTLYARFNGCDGTYHGVFEAWWMGPPSERKGQYPFTFVIPRDNWITDKTFKVDMPFEEPGFYEFRIMLDDGDYIAHQLYVDYPE